MVIPLDTKVKFSNVICTSPWITKFTVNPGKPTIHSAINVNIVQISPNNIDNIAHTISFPTNNFLNEIGMVIIFFKTSSFSSRDIIYPAIKAMHIGKIIDILFLITCSIKYRKSHTDPSLAIEVKSVNRTESSIRAIPAHII